MHKSFYDIGENSRNVILLSTKSGKIDCRLFSEIEPNDKLYGFDLIFVAPLQKSFNPDYQDVQQLVPYSNSENTYFFQNITMIWKKI